MRELVAGADGCRGGWVMAVTGPAGGSPVEFSGWPSFEALWAETCRREMLAVGVDMPVGLPGSERRTADVEARRLLGPRRSSLFWTPPLCVLDAADHAEANRRSRRRTARGLSAQSFALMPKVREVRNALKPKVFAPESRPRAAEVHPETSFAVLTGRPMSASRKQRAGIDERLETLSDDFPGIGGSDCGRILARAAPASSRRPLGRRRRGLDRPPSGRRHRPVPGRRRDGRNRLPDEHLGVGQFWEEQIGRIGKVRAVGSER